MTYESNIKIKKHFAVEKHKGCIYSVFVNETNKLKKDITSLRFKRVSNFSKFTSQEAFILEKAEEDLTEEEKKKFEKDKLDQREKNKIHTFWYQSKDLIMIVSAKRIDFFMAEGEIKKTLIAYGPNDELIFAKCIEYEEREMLLVVDKKLNLLIYDMSRLKRIATANTSQSLQYSPS